jgi:hypothetical protein
LVRVEPKTEKLEILVANLRYYVVYLAEFVTAIFGVIVVLILFKKIRCK